MDSTLSRSNHIIWETTGQNSSKESVHNYPKRVCRGTLREEALLVRRQRAETLATLNDSQKIELSPRQTNTNSYDIYCESRRSLPDDQRSSHSRDNGDQISLPDDQRSRHSIDSGGLDILTSPFRTLAESCGFKVIQDEDDSTSCCGSDDGNKYNKTLYASSSSEISPCKHTRNSSDHTIVDHNGNIQSLTQTPSVRQSIVKTRRPTPAINHTTNIEFHDRRAERDTMYDSDDTKGNLQVTRSFENETSHRTNYLQSCSENDRKVTKDNELIPRAMNERGSNERSMQMASNKSSVRNMTHNKRSIKQFQHPNGQEEDASYENGSTKSRTFIRDRTDNLNETTRLPKQGSEPIHSTPDQNCFIRQRDIHSDISRTRHVPQSNDNMKRVSSRLTSDGSNDRSDTSCDRDTIAIEANVTDTGRLTHDCNEHLSSGANYVEKRCRRQPKVFVEKIHPSSIYETNKAGNSPQNSTTGQNDKDSNSVGGYAFYQQNTISDTNSECSDADNRTIDKKLLNKNKQYLANPNKQLKQTAITNLDKPLGNTSYKISRRGKGSACGVMRFLKPSPDKVEAVEKSEDLQHITPKQNLEYSTESSTRHDALSGGGDGMTSATNTHSNKHTDRHDTNSTRHSNMKCASGCESSTDTIRNKQTDRHDTNSTRHSNMKCTSECTSSTKRVDKPSYLSLAEQEVFKEIAKIKEQEFKTVLHNTQSFKQDERHSYLNVHNTTSCHKNDRIEPPNPIVNKTSSQGQTRSHNLYQGNQNPQITLSENNDNSTYINGYKDNVSLDTTDSNHPKLDQHEPYSCQKQEQCITCQRVLNDDIRSETSLKHSQETNVDVHCEDEKFRPPQNDIGELRQQTSYENKHGRHDSISSLQASHKTGNDCKPISENRVYGHTAIDDGKTSHNNEAPLQNVLAPVANPSLHHHRGFNINSNYECDDNDDGGIPGSRFIGQYFLELWKNQCLCDVRLRVGNWSYLAHKIVLAAFSDFFCPSDPHCMPSICFDIPNATPDAVHQILLYLYTSEMEITDYTIESVLCAAESLGVSEVINLVKEILDNPTPENFEHYLEIRGRHGFPAKLTDYPDLMRDHILDLSSSPTFLELDLSEVQALLADPEVKVDSESDMIELIARWIEYSPLERIACSADLLSYVNFDCIPADTLADIVERKRNVFSRDAFSLFLNAFKNRSITAECPPCPTAHSEMMQQSYNNSTLKKQLYPSNNKSTNADIYRHPQAQVQPPHYQDVCDNRAYQQDNGRSMGRRESVTRMPRRFHRKVTPMGLARPLSAQSFNGNGWVSDTGQSRPSSQVTSHHAPSDTCQSRPSSAGCGQKRFATTQSRMATPREIMSMSMASRGDGEGGSRLGKQNRVTRISGMGGNYSIANPPRSFGGYRGCNNANANFCYDTEGDQSARTTPSGSMVNVQPIWDDGTSPGYRGGSPWPSSPGGYNDQHQTACNTFKVVRGGRGPRWEHKSPNRDRSASKRVTFM